MIQPVETTVVGTDRASALAQLARAVAVAPGPAEIAQAALAALKRSFPTAAAWHVHELPAGTDSLVARGEEPISPALSAAGYAALHRAIKERTPLLEVLDHAAGDAPGGGGPAARLAVVPVLYVAEQGQEPGSPVLGTLAVAFSSPTPNTTGEEIEWLEVLAQHAALGLAQVRLRDALLDAERRCRETKDTVEARVEARVEQLVGRGKQLEALFQLSSQISKTLDEEKVTGMALDHLVSLTGSRFGFVVMVAPAGALELTCARGLRKPEIEALRRALSEPNHTLVETIALDQRTIRENEGAELPAGEGATLRLDSLLAVPLGVLPRKGPPGGTLPKGRSAPLGALVLVGRMPGYDEADERLVAMFGAQVGVAVQNARMVAKVENSLQTRRRELTSLSRVAQELAAAAGEAAVVERVVAIISETFDARAAWVMLRDEPGGPLRMRHYQGEGSELFAPMVVAEGALPRSSDPGMVGEALERLCPVFRTDICLDPGSIIWGACHPAPPRGSGGTGDCKLETMLCVPLIVQERALGVLGIDSTRFSPRRPPRPQDLDLIQAFAAQAAVAIENARLMAAAVHREKLLNAITDAVREPLDVGGILQRAVERLGPALAVSRCVALLPQGNGEYVEYAWAEPGFELLSDHILWESCPIVQRLEETGQPLALVDASELAGSTQPADGRASSRSTLGIPALRNGKLVALFLFHQCDRAREWREEDLSLAQRVIAQVAVAVENAQLFAQALAQEKFQRTLTEIATAVGSSVELTQVLRAVGEQGMRLLNADAAYIWRLDEASRELVSAAAVGHKAEKFQDLRVALSRWSFHVVRAASERRPIAANGVGLDRQASQRLNRMFDCRSLLAVPLIARDKVIGVVQFSATAEGARFEDDQVAEAEILVAQAATAMENAQLYEEERDRAEELEVLWRIGQEVAENLQPERIFQSIVAGARRVLGVDAASLMMFTEDRQMLTIAEQEGLSEEHVAAVRFRRGERIPRCIAVDGAHRFTTNLGQDRYYPAAAGQERLQSMLSVPMPDGAHIVGALNVYSSRRRHFRVEEAQKLDLLASFAMTTLRQARQFQREHEIAQAFQRDLLPELKLEVAGLDVARRSIAALAREADVGGDFYDVHQVSESKIGLVIGDVSGKGLAAAPQTAMVKCMLRAFAFESSSPSQVMERLNRLLFRTTDAEQFVTLFYGLLDVEKGELAYANAGHELPLVLRRGSGSPELLETTGPLLGLDGGSGYRQVTTFISPGDTLVLYTDGFTEARRGNTFLQVEGLASLLGEYREETADDMVEGVSQSVTDYSGGSLRDDATILVVKSMG